MSNSEEDSSTTIEESLLLLSTCEICFNFIGPTIFQCASGHHFCELCAHRLDNCPTCRLSLPRNGIRCRVLENVLRSLPSIECTQKDCTVKLPYDMMGFHYCNCDYREVICPIIGCVWNGKAQNIEKHVEESHKEEIISVPEEEAIFTLGNLDSCTIDAFSETILKTTADNQLYILGCWMMRGQHYTNSIVVTIMHLGVNHPDQLPITVLLQAHDDDYEVAVSRIPWHVHDDITDMYKSRRNLIVDVDLALRLSKPMAIFRSADQLKRSPLLEGLNIQIGVRFNHEGTIKGTNGPHSLELKEHAIQHIDY